MEGYLIYGETLNKAHTEFYDKRFLYRPIRPFALQLHVSF